VTAVNDAPVIEGSVDLGAIKEDTEIKFEASDLLKNASDVDGDKLSILDVSVDKEFGSIEYSTDKEGNVETVKFIPNENFNGEDVPINFVASDGQVKVEGKSTIDVLAVNDGPVAVDDGSVGHIELSDITSSNITIANSESINLNGSEDFSISVSVTPDGVQKGGDIIFNKENAVELAFDSDGTLQFAMQTEDETWTWHSTDVPFDTDAANNIAFSYDGEKVTISNTNVDGDTSTYIQSYTGGVVDTYSNNDLMIGNRPYGGGRYSTDGGIDDISMNVNGQEVLTLNFDGADPLADTSGYGNNAKLGDGTSVVKSTSIETTEDTPLTINAETLLANDTDIDGDTLSITAVSEEVVDSNGKVVGTAEQDDKGNIVFTPDDTLDALNEGESSSVTFNYTVSDGKGGTDTASVTLNVTGTNDAPEITVVDSTIAEDTAQVIATASDIDGTISLSNSTANHGTLAMSTKGDITYTPDADYNGTDNVSISVTDDKGATTTQSIDLTIDPANDNPVAVDDNTHPVEVTTTSTIFSTSFESVTSSGDDLFHDTVEGWRSDGKIEVRTQEMDDGVAADGTQYIELNDDAIDYYDDAPNIHRDIKTNSNGDYNLTFQYSARPGNDASVCRFEVVLDGEVLGTFSSDGSNLTEPSWQAGSINFPGDGNPAKLEFREAGVDVDYGRGALIDNITLEETVTSTSNQAITIGEDSSLNIDVLTNDTDIEGDTLTITEIQDQEVKEGGEPVEVTDGDNNVLGTAQLVEGKIQFNPTGTLQNLNDGENQAVAFEYTVSDGHGGSDTANVKLTVSGSDDIAETIDIKGDINNATNNVETDDYIGNLTTGDGHDTVSIGNDIADGREVSTNAGDDVVSVTDDLKEGSSLDTGAGNDTITVGDDVLQSSTITSGSGDDTVTIKGDLQGDSSIDAGSGDDQISIAGAADGTVDGGTGTDTVVLSGNENEYNIIKNEDNSFAIQDKEGSIDDVLTVSNVEQFQFADNTVDAGDLTLSSKLIDGAVEGVEYNTTSGLHGFTDESGGFDFKDGDDVTFTIGGVTLGTATAGDVATGKTFLQDIADVDRTDLNDEYLENMATFLQSIDENSNAYDGIVVTDEIREALADADIDLRTASEDDVQQLVEELDKTFVGEDAAMDHVEDMLVAHTNIAHDDFEEHIDDDTTGIEQSIRSEQKKESKTTVASATGLAADEASSAMEQTRVDEVSDLSLNIPSLELPGEEQQEAQEIATEQTAAVKQDVTQQNEIAAPDGSDEGTVLTDALADDDLGHSLPSASLSTLFDEKNENEISTPSATVDDDKKDVKTEQTTAIIEEDEATVATEVVGNKPAPVAEEVVESDDTSSSEAEMESIADEEKTEATEVETEDELSLSTDDLHITLDDDSSTETSNSSNTESESKEDSDSEESSSNSLDRFSADSNSEETGSSAIDEFSATSDSEDDSELGALEELDATDDAESDQAEDAGLSEADAVQEEVSQEPDTVDTNGVG